MTDRFEEIQVTHAGKRCALAWAPRMGDWFTSSSPRNGNSNAEGPWDHWADLAVRILRDPLTAKVRPEAHTAVQDVKPADFYDEANVHLTEADLAQRFGDEGAARHPADVLPAPKLATNPAERPVDLNNLTTRTPHRWPTNPARPPAGGACPPRT